MEGLCEFCGVVRAVVYCRADAAKLCLHCDSCVHSANSLSRRHDRSLICDKCNSQPAVVRCLEDKVSLCQGCNWNGNGCSGPGHQCHKLSFYSGCPSLSDFSTIWSSVLDMPIPTNFIDTTTTTNNYSTLLSMNDNIAKANDGSIGLVANRLNELASCLKFDPWIITPSPIITPNPNYQAPPFLTEETSLLSKDGSPINGKDVGGGIHEGVLCCEGVVELDDVALMLENSGYDDMLGNSEVNSRYCREEGALGCLALENNLSVTESNYSHVDNNTLEAAASSSVQQDCLGFQSSRNYSNSANNLIQSSNCLLMNPAAPAGCNRNISLGLIPPGPGQVHSTISLTLSNITGESSAADYQDCGLSPVFLTGDSPWESNLEATCPQARDKAKMRYNEKKKTRTFGKQIRYASRKARADTRRRVKGRFVKAGEAYDYDPLVTRDF